MQWERKGLIYCPKGEKTDWINNSVLTPQPFLLSEEIIRVYCSFRDYNGIGRIGYIDLEARNPSKIIKISKNPIVLLGKDGCFDDNGMLLGDVIRVNDKIYMYYVAFQLVKKVKFLAFSGLAISSDGGDSFVRLQDYPVMDRTNEGIYGRCIHSVIYDKGTFRVWYSVIYGWQDINNVPYPKYDIRYTESKNGILFPDRGEFCISCNSNEYRIGRPKVRKVNENLYEMRYTSDTYNKEYRSGYAESRDGIHWVRKDDESSIKPSFIQGDFDSEEASYPVVCQTKYGTYIFYDGNGMGKKGFGYAVYHE